jgi:predicted nuclease with TOPRIM domain
MSQLTQTKRQEVFDEKGNCCYFCEKTREEHREQRGRDLDIHHVVPSFDGGSDDVENLIPVCITCHKRLESTQGEALKRIAQKKTKREELAKLRRERDRLKSRIDSLEEKVWTPDEVSVDNLVDYIAVEGDKDINRVDFDVISKIGRRKAVVYDDREKAVEAYNEWGDRMDRNWVRIPKSQMQEIVELVVQGLEQ